VRPIVVVLAVPTVFAAGFGLWAAIRGTHRSPVVALVLTFVPTVEYILASPTGPQSLVSLPLGPVTLYSADVIALLLTLAVARRLWQSPSRITWPSAALLAFGAVALYSFARGVLDGDVFDAANQFRKHFYFAVAGLYFSTIPWTVSARRHLLRAWTLTAAALAVFSIIRLALPLDGLLGPMFGGPGGDRPIHAAAALVVAMGALLSIGWSAARLLPAFLLLATVVVQHRSVWVATTAAFLTFAVMSAKRNVLQVGGLAVATLMALLLSPIGPSLLEPLDRAAADRSSFEWRTEGWSSLVSAQLQRPGDWALGRPMGTPWTRTVFATVVDSSPHNLYIELLLRVGLIGLLLFALTYALTTVAAFRFRAPGARALPLAVVVGQLVYAIPYSLDMSQGALLGMMILTVSSAACRDDREPVRRKI
jgi:O-antigen ligase